MINISNEVFESNVEPPPQAISNVSTKEINISNEVFLGIEEGFCDASKTPPTQSLQPSFEWCFVYVVWYMVPKQHIDKFRDRNPCLEDLIVDPLDGLEGSMDDEQLEDTIGGHHSEMDAQNSHSDQAIEDFISNESEFEFEKTIR